jgi:hypothetical protein
VGSSFQLLLDKRILLLEGEITLLPGETTSTLDLSSPLAIKFSFLFWLSRPFLITECIRVSCASALVRSSSSSPASDLIFFRRTFISVCCRALRVASSVSILPCLSLCHPSSSFWASSLICFWTRWASKKLPIKKDTYAVWPNFPRFSSGSAARRTPFQFQKFSAQVFPFRIHTPSAASP